MTCHDARKRASVPLAARYVCSNAWYLSFSLSHNWLQGGKNSNDKKKSIGLPPAKVTFFTVCEAAGTHSSSVRASGNQWQC
jgi:hypothetical protein